MDDFLKDRVQKLVKSMKAKVAHSNAVKDFTDSNRIAQMGEDSIAADKTSAVLNRNEDKEDCDCKDKNDCECEDIAPVDDEMEKREKFVKSVMDSFKAVSNAYLKKMELEKGRMATHQEMQGIRDKKQSKKLWDKWNEENKKFQEGQKKDDKNPKYPSKKDLEYPEKIAASEHMAKKQGVPKGADSKTHERCVKKVKKKGHDKSSAYAICNEAGAGMDKAENRCWEGYEPTPGKKPYSEGSCRKISKDEDTVSDKHGRYEGPDRRKASTKTSRRKGPSGRKIKSKKPIEEKRSTGRKRPYDRLPKRAPNFDRLKELAAERKAKAAQQKKQQAIENAVAGGAPREVPEVAMKNAEKPFHGYNKNKHSKEGGLSEKERNKINREEGSNLKAPVSSKAAKKSPKKAARRKSFCARMKGNKGPTSKKGKLTPKGAALKRWDCN